MEDEELSAKVIGCAYRVGSSMGTGFLESVYQKCMQIELLNAGLTIEPQKKITVYYQDQIVGVYIADFLIESRLVVELKSVRLVSPVHELQSVNYLKATRINVGVLINFGERGVEIKRKHRLYQHPNAES
jgi:GxxExxY protein